MEREPEVPGSRIDSDTVYGGTMTPEEFMEAEFRVNETPAWKSENVPAPFNVKINGKVFTLEYHNTRGWLFDGEYSWMSFIWHKPEVGEAEYFVPEEVGMEGFQMLYSELINRGFHIGNRRTPTREAYNLNESRMKAGRSIADVLSQIIREAEDGD